MCQPPMNRMCIQDASKPKVYKRQFTICLPPLYNNVSEFDLVEWVELHRILGVEKFFIYMYNVSNNIDRALNYYVNAGVMEVLPWRIPFGSEDIYYNGQSAALNDCLFRSKPVSEFVASLAKDEFIIPRSDGVRRWSQMLNKLHSYADGYLFSSASFINEMKEEQQHELPMSLNERLITLSRIRREGKVDPLNSPTKHISRTENVDWIQVHLVPDVRLLWVPASIGLIHHYRDNKHNAINNYTDLTVVTKYRQTLMMKVFNVWRSIVQNTTDNARG